MEDAETGEQLYVDTHDRGFRRRFAEAAGRREAAVGDAFKRAGVDAMVALHRRGPRPGDRPHGDPAPPAPEVADVLHLAADARAARPRPGRRARSTAGSNGVAGGGSAASRRARARQAGVRSDRPVCASGSRRPCSSPASRSWSSPWPGRRAWSTCRARRAPSSSPSTSRAAWPPTTSSRPGWMPPRRRPGRSSSASRRASSIGVVAFSDAGLSVQTPTSDQATVLAAIDRLAPQRGTSLGQGILASLNTIAVAEAGPSATTTAIARPTRRPSRPRCRRGPTRRRSSSSLTDGENNEPPDPLAAAQTAADRGVRIYTVGHRQRGRDDPRPRRVQGPHPARRGDPPADRPDHRRRLLQRRRRRRAPVGLRATSTCAWRSSRRRSRSRPCSPARACCSSSSAACARSPVLGRLP